MSETVENETSWRGPLADVRVLDLTRVLAGPFATQILGDLGAEILKVEAPGKGDDIRAIAPFAPGGESFTGGCTTDGTPSALK